MRTKNSLRIQKFVFYGFLIAAFLVVIASLCFVADGWIIFKAESDNTSSGFYFEFRTNLRLALQTMVAAGEGDKFLSLFPELAKYITDYNFNSNAVYSAIFSTANEASSFYRSFWFEIQNANDVMFYTGLISLALVAICGITGSFTRKKFYISNLVSGCVTGLFGIVMSIIMVVMSMNIYSDFQKITLDVDYYLQANILAGGSNITDVVNGNQCFIGVAVGIIFGILSAGFIAYNVFRFVKTRQFVKSEKLAKEVVINE